jgi:hypothetical protein
MGADGHIVIMKLDDFQRDNPGVAPDDIGLYTGTMLGVQACWGYVGAPYYEPTYGRYDTEVFIADAPKGKQLRPRTKKELAMLAAAAATFDANAERHEVWT